jgi:5'-nucleotidase
MRLNGRSVDASRAYRVVLNNYLASGGDGLSEFTAGIDVKDTGIIDLDALIDWIAKGQTPPVPNRIRFAAP